MLEVNAIYFILLVEALVVLLVLVLLWILIGVMRKRRRNRAMRQLAARIGQRAQWRGERTEAFLQAVFRLEGEDLRRARAAIDKSENEFIQLLLNGLRRGETGQIGALEDALDKLVDAYKCLLPRVAEGVPATPDESLNIGALRSQNEALRSKLSAVENRLSDMIAEFGSMFAGGKDHEVDLHELKKRLAAMQPDAEPDAGP